MCGVGKKAEPRLFPAALVTQGNEAANATKSLTWLHSGREKSRKGEHTSNDTHVVKAAVNTGTYTCDCLQSEVEPIVEVSR